MPSSARTYRSLDHFAPEQGPVFYSVDLSDYFAEEEHVSGQCITCGGTRISPRGLSNAIKRLPEIREAKTPLLLPSR
jgi:hypothetical protein